MKTDVCEMSKEAIEFNIGRQQCWRGLYLKLHDYTHVNTCDRILAELLAELAFRGVKC